MHRMDQTENVIEQYKDDKNLSIRSQLHAKYSTNKQGFHPWLFEKYRFSPGDRILELGCGNSAQWNNRISQLPKDCILVLSDFSDGMVKIVWDKYSSHKSILAQKIDIQNIPYPNECFDVIIANHMLYHVPDITKALSEIQRVLKSGGTFYAATNGNGGMRTFLRKAFQKIHPESDAFTKDLSFHLQNGESILSRYFDNVQKVDFEDSFSITNTHDLMDWLKSTVTMASYSEEDLSGLYEYFEGIRQKDGTINIPKETGMFIATKT